VIPAFRRLAATRERLLPYLTVAARRAVMAGEPLMRPLFFDHPDDARVWDHPLEWMLGDSLLVAPVVDEGAETVDAYLPPGDWRDAFTGKRLAGGGIVTRTTTWDEAPVWVRERDWPELGSAFREGGTSLPR
jgi:alpha-glucosidase (family GH31 glycosyl hydrolase)